MKTINLDSQEIKGLTDQFGTAKHGGKGGEMWLA